jgi:hypothetical protein
MSVSQTSDSIPVVARMERTSLRSAPSDRPSGRSASSIHRIARPWRNDVNRPPDFERLRAVAADSPTIELLGPPPFDLAEEPAPA